VQQHERPVGVVRWYHPDLVEIAVDEAAVQRVVLDASAARRPVAADQVAGDDVDPNRRDDDDG
jgi:hypothetical protein